MTFGNRHSVDVSGVAVAGQAGYFQSPVFRAAFVQGLSALAGGVFGACLWVSFQPLPVIKPYHFVLDVGVPVKPVAKVAPVVAPVAAVPAAVPATPSAPVAPPGVPAPAAAAQDVAVNPASAMTPTAQAGGIVADPDMASVPSSMVPVISPGSVVPATVESAPIAPVPAAPPSVTAVAVPKSLTLPVAGLFEEKPPYGRLPVVRTTDHQRPFDVYRQPVDPAALTKPLVAVVISDFGLSERAVTDVINQLPPGVNVLMSRVAVGAPTLAQAAYDKGFELWLDLAVEPENYPSDDPGADALFSNASIEQNQEALMRQMGAFPGYAGVFVNQASPYLSNEQDGDFLSRALFDRGVGLVVAAPSVDPIISKNARAAKAPFFQGDMIVVEDASRAVAAMTQAEEQARTKGYSILILPPQKGVRLMLEGWIKSLPDKGAMLVPLSAIAERGLTLMAER